MFSFQRRRDCYVFFTHVVVCYVFWTCVLYGHSLHVTRCVWWKSVRTVIYIWKRYPCNWRSLESSEWGRRSKKTTASFYLPCSKHTYCASSIAKSWKKLIIKIIVPFYSKANIVVSKLNLSEIQAGGEDLWWETSPSWRQWRVQATKIYMPNYLHLLFFMGKTIGLFGSLKRREGRLKGERVIQLPCLEVF